MRIRGGSIHQFGFGVLLAGAKDNRLEHLRISKAHYYGMNIRDTSGTVVTHNVLKQNGVSEDNATNLLVIRSQSMVLNENVLIDSAGVGLLTFDLADSRLNGNSLDGNDGGIAVWGTSARNLVRGNEVTHSKGSSIDLVGGTGNRVELNRMADNGDGIILSDERGTTVQQNVVKGTGFYGAPDTGGFGVILDGADANLIRHNVILDGRGPAILVTKLDSPTTADDNAVVGNLVNSRLDDGILIGEGASGTKVSRNVAYGNGDDGIDVDSATSSLSANTAIHNRDLGIEAVPGTIDGGSNRAFVNGNPQQCTNIVCTPPPTSSR